MALSFCCGAECEVSAVGAAVPSGTRKHWTTISAAVTNVATTVRTGSRSWRSNPSSAQGQLAHTPPASQNRLAMRAYMRFATLPSADTPLLAGVSSATEGAGFKSSNSTITTQSGATYGGSGVTVTTGVWYCVETIVDISANPHTIDVWVDGKQVAQQTNAVAATTFSSWLVGINASTSADLYIDDIAVTWSTGAVTRIGPGATYGLIPNVDGTHSFTANDFLYDTGGAIAVSATDVNTQLADALDTSVGNFVNQAITRATGYVAVGFPDMTVTPPGSAVNGVEVVAAFHAAGTGANTNSMRLWDGTNESAIYALADFSETSILIPTWHRTTAADGGAWTVTDVNNTQVRWGFSDDATPDIYLDGVRLEVDVPWFIAGSTATETDTAYAGSVFSSVVQGSLATETDTAYRGSILAPSLNGFLATETDDALRGAGKVTPPGSAFTITLGTTYNTGGTTATSHVISLPASHASGDLLLVVFQTDSDRADTVTFPGDWTQLFEVQVDAAGSSNLAVGYKTSDGTGTTVTLTTAMGENATGRVYRIQNWYGSGAPEYATATGTSANPDPPNLTPTWGSAATWWLACYSNNGGVGANSVYPLTDNQWFAGTGGSGSAGGAACDQVETATSKNPGTFTDDFSAAWAAATIAVRPAAAGTPTTYVFGSLATETDTAYAGTAQSSSPTIQGSLATETDSAYAGGRGQTVQGALATETEQALAGAPRVALPGALASETETAYAGSYAIGGSTATESDSALAGTPSVALAGATATEDDSAYSGSYAVGGSTAVETDSALPGGWVLPGSTALETDSALAGTLARVVVGALAQEADEALAGASATSLAGALAGETDSALAGSPALIWPGALATELEVALPGGLIWPGALAQETDSAYAGSASGANEIPGSLATELDDAYVGSPALALPGATASEADAAYVAAGWVLGGALALETEVALPGGWVLPGALATETEVAYAGTALEGLLVAGALATENDDAYSSSPAVTLPGALALETDFGYAGSTAFGGSTALELDDAYAGTLALALAGALATETDTAYAGSVPQGETIYGSLATETDSAYAGTVAQGLPGALATETDSAYAGSVVRKVLGALATETDTAYTGFARILAKVGGVVETNWVYVESAGKPGPFLDGNGNLYVLVGNEPVGSAYIVMAKSTDGGASWTEVGGASRPTQIDTECCQVVQIGTALHVLHQQSGRDVYYHRFNTSDAGASPDAWVEKDTLVYNGDGTSSDQQCTLVARSDGSLVAAYRTNVVSSLGHIGYAVRSTGGSWGSTSTLDHGGAGAYYRGVSAVTGEADKVHFFYAADISGTDHIWHRSLDSGGTLSSAEQVSDNVTKVSSSYDMPLTQPAYYDDAGVERVTVAWIRNSNNYLASAVVEDDATPAAEVAVSTAAISGNFMDGHCIAAQLVADPDNKVVYAFFADASTQDLWVSTSTDGGAWSTPVEVFDGRTVTWFDGLQVYTRNGRRRIGMFWSEGTTYNVDETLWFSEYALPIVEAYTVQGSTAVESDDAYAGGIRIGGALATETDSAYAGAPRVSLPGALAQEADAAYSGSYLLGGSTATETDTAYAGTIGRALPGELALEADSAYAGAPRLALPGALAQELEVALAGGIGHYRPGELAQEADTALEGAPAIVLPGALATELEVALGGGIIWPGSSSSETDSAIAGTPAYGWPGATAQELDEALAGTVDAVVYGGTCQETDESFPGVVFMAFEAEPAEVTVEALDAEVDLLVHAEASPAEVAVSAADATYALGTLAVSALPATVTTQCRDAFVVLRPVETHAAEAEPAYVTVVASDAVASYGAYALPATVSVVASDAHVEVTLVVTSPAASPALVTVVVPDAEVSTPDLWPIERAPREPRLRVRGGRARVLEGPGARARGGRVMVTADAGAKYREGP